MHRHLTTTVALTCLLSTTALAQTAVGTGVGVSESNSASGAVAIAGSGGRGGNSSLTVNNPANTTSTVNQNLSGTTTSNINQHVSGSTRTETVASGTQTIKNVPLVAAPGLSSAGLETCLGSASGGVGIAGFGVSGGSTYKDEDCTARLDSRTLFAMGLKGAAVARLCVRPDIWRSMPDICARYWPVGQPLPQGVYVAAPLVAPAGTYMSASTTIEVIDGKSGRTRPCSNYSETKQKCFAWADAPRKQRVAAITPTKQVSPPRKPKIDPPQLPESITAGTPAPSIP